MTPEQDERYLSALESLAVSLDRLATLAERAVNRYAPAKHEPRDATVTRIPSDEDRRRESLGGSAPIGEWLDEQPGPTEKDFLERQAKAKSSSERKDTSAKKGSSETD